MKAHQFTNEILNRKLNNLGTGPVTGLPAQGTDDTPDHSPGAGPSTARTIVHMMQNMLDDLNVMHPGLRDDVRAANDDGPGDGGGSPSSSSSSSSDGNEPARSPRNMTGRCLHKAVLKLQQLKLQQLRHFQQLRFLKLYL